MSKLVVPALALSLFAGWQQLGLSLLNLPASFDGSKVVRDVAYGTQPWQKLDIYVPHASTSTTMPVVIFFYGGRWNSGTRQDYRFAAAAFAKRGYITVIPDYAKYPAVRFPAFVEDGARAIAFVHDHIVAHGGDPKRIHVAGHSAGAHLGALIAADRRYLGAHGKTPKQVIASFAGLAGPYDFVPDEPDLMDMFGPPSRYPAMQVTTFVTGQEPPMLLQWGAVDTTVRRYNLDKLQARIEAVGGRVRSKIYPDVDHVGILTALSWYNPRRVPVADDLAAFFKAAEAGR